MSRILCLRSVASRGSSRVAFALNRRYTTDTALKTVDLKHDILQSGNHANTPLVILHGLFGSKRNWNSLGKSYARALQAPVYTLDLRNHGDSPHVRPHTYEAMAADLLSFCKQHDLSKINLLGHSMGGKVAMTLALNPNLPEGMVSKLIVEDIAPANGSISLEFTAYVEAMREIEAAKVKTRNEAAQILRKTEQDPSIVGFLLTNLVPASAEQEYAKFKIPLDIISDHIDDIGSFPYKPGEVKWEGETLFVKGTKSKYINRKNLPLTTQFFPNSKLYTVDAGHWVHVEKSAAFGETIVKFVQQGLSSIADESDKYR